MENNALHPMHNPMKMEVIKTMSVYEEPTAAKAFAPNVLPMMNVSAILYPCWSKFPKISG